MFSTYEVLIREFLLQLQLIISKCIFGNQVKRFRLLHNIEIIEALANDHCAIGFVVCLNPTIKRRLAFSKVEKPATNSFCVKAALNSILYPLRICNQRKTNALPSIACFER